LLASRSMDACVARRPERPISIAAMSTNHHRDSARSL
jgi:hypothetical protein